MQNQENNNAILEEILAVPSNQIITDRFEKNEDPANCTGLCSSGQCKGMN